MSRAVDGACGGVVTQHDLDVAVSLRRRAREAHEEARRHNLDLAAALLAGEVSEEGRYRPSVARVRFRDGPREGTVMLAIYDAEAVGPGPVLVAAFNPEDLT